jgi:hypothetical protein
MGLSYGAAAQELREKLTVGGGVKTEVLVVFGPNDKQLHPEESCPAPKLDRAGMLMRLCREESRIRRGESASSGSAKKPRFAGDAGQVEEVTVWVTVVVAIVLAEVTLATSKL